MKRIVILGATSGMVQPLLRSMAEAKNELLLVARSAERLDDLRSDLLVRGSPRIVTLPADFNESQRAIFEFTNEYFSNFDTVLLSYGTMLDQAQSQIDPDDAVCELQTNLVSAVALLTLFARYLESRGSGTIAVITSVAGDRGRRSNYVYGAAKGGLSIFLEGLRSRLHPYGVRVLTIKAGPVATQMTANMTGVPLIARADLVAKDIYKALENPQVDVIYTPKRWRWIMAAVKMIPESVFKRLSF